MEDESRYTTEVATQTALDCENVYDVQVEASEFGNKFNLLRGERTSKDVDKCVIRNRILAMRLF